VPQAVIDLFPRGIVNIHPSLLPHHRGPTPLESVILHNEPATGVSIMQLVRDMDAGPVFGQVELPLAGTETKQDLANTLLQKGAELLIELLPAICAEELLPLPQDELKATYDQLINKEDGQLDFTKPAEQLEREVRAYAEWPKSRTQLAGRDVTIEQAHVEIGVGKPGSVWRDSANQFGVYCGQDILVIDQLRPAGKGSMTAAAFLAGYNPL
jgi:methionyl-tRNA formyltransferase